MRKFLTKFLSSWRKGKAGAFETVRVNWFDPSITEEKIALPYDQRIDENENEFAWLVKYN